MKILIVGLGLIGGSYAKGLSQKGYEVYGVDLNEESLVFAKEHDFIKEGSKDAIDLIPSMDMIILGLYPKAILPWLKKYQPYFNEKQVITDVAGIKTEICEEATKLSLPAMFVGSHPMAGREKVGVTFADENIFKGKTNFLICPIEGTNEYAIKKVEEIANALEFGKIHLITPEHHDMMIAYTSQLTHLIAVSLVNSEAGTDVTSFIGDSYRDLTRIAKINAELWSELFLDNKDALVAMIESFEKEIHTMKEAVLTGDKETLTNCFHSSKEKREAME